MSNISKYFVILESLKLPEGANLEKKFREEETSTDILKKNVECLRDFIKLEPQYLLRKLLIDMELNHLLNVDDIANFDDTKILYSIYSIYMLLDITKNVNFNSDVLEDLVSENHKALIIAAIRDVAYYSLQQHLHESFYVGKTALFHRIQNVNSDNFAFLEILVEAFTRLLFIRPLHIGRSLEAPLLDYMSGIFSLLLVHDSKLYILPEQQYGNMMSYLQKIWLTLPRKLYIRNLILLKSCAALPELGQKAIHKQLLLRLWAPGGFMALVFALTESNAIKEEKNIADVIAKIVAQPDFTNKARKSLITQIQEFADTCLKTKDMEQYLDIAFNALYQMCETSVDMQTYMKQWLHQQLQIFIEPDDKDKAKIEIMEFKKFCTLIALLHHMFCRSSMKHFSMDFLTPYLCLLLKCHDGLIKHEAVIVTTAQHHLSDMILKCLNDYEVKDLDNVILCLNKENYPKDWYHLHGNISFMPNSLMLQEMQILIDENENKPMSWHPLSALVAVLKESKHYLLTYHIFKMLFRSLPTTLKDHKFSESISRDSSLLQNEEEIYNMVINDLSNNIFSNFQHIRALEALIQLPQVQSLIEQNIMDIVKLLKELIVTFGNLPLNEENADKPYSIIMIALSLAKEIIDNTDMEIENIRKELLKPLKDLQKNIDNCNGNLLYQISNLLQILTNNNLNSNKEGKNSKGMAFEEARSLIESNESYEQVEGFDKLIKLINIRDQHTISNGHTILALALNKLKSPESYTFLNCVRLFKSVITILESEVLEMLHAEYLNDSNSIDYRLVIGEAILQIGKELGPLVYKYKNILLNCFFNGCRSNLDEFRCSSFSNLSQLCRILTFQVHHYFEELLNLIECELTTGKYLPAKRASIMILKDLLEGMDDLMDYKSMLLSIYRILKNLMASKDCDEVMRLHAIIALNCLSLKCQKLLDALLNPKMKKEFVTPNSNNNTRSKGSLHDCLLHMN